MKWREVRWRFPAELMATLEQLEEAERTRAEQADGKPRVRDLETYAALLLMAGLDQRRKGFDADAAKMRLIQPATVADVAAVARGARR